MYIESYMRKLLFNINFSGTSSKKVTFNMTVSVRLSSAQTCRWTLFPQVSIT